MARLLERGCPVDAADYDGRSLLHVAVHNKQEVRAGWTRTWSLPYCCRAPCAACWAVHDNYCFVLRGRLCSCLDPPQLPPSLSTVCFVPHVVLVMCMQAVVKQLLAAGADPNVRSSSGSSPFLEAAMEVSPAIQVRYAMGVQSAPFTLAASWPVGLLTMRG